MDAGDRHRIPPELTNVSHPLETLSLHLYHIANGVIAPPEAEVNVSESLAIGQRRLESSRHLFQLDSIQPSLVP